MMSNPGCGGISRPKQNCMFFFWWLYGQDSSQQCVTTPMIFRWVPQSHDSLNKPFRAKFLHQSDIWLVVWNMAFIYPYIRNVIIPTDELIFFRGVGEPPTRYQWKSHIFWQDRHFPCVHLWMVASPCCLARYVFHILFQLFSSICSLSKIVWYVFEKRLFRR